jgi:hypothetical protein
MFSVGMSLAVVACGSSSGANDAGKADSQARAVVPIASVGGAVAARGVEALSASAAASAIATPAVAMPKVQARATSGEGLTVKRFVVANKIQDREPVLEQGALLANGKPIYAFAELANETADATQVRITFERKGSSDRVGNVTLSVPAKAGRYRTWGNTRFVREAGTWEAVLWTENGKELGRAEFEVAGS